MALCDWSHRHFYVVVVVVEVKLLAFYEHVIKLESYG